MASPFVALVGAIAVLWMASEPLCEHSRGLAGDAMALAFAAPLALAWVGLARYGRAPEPDGLGGPVRFVELAAREPGLVAVLATAIVLAASPPWDVHLLFVAGALAWLVLGRAVGRARAHPHATEQIAVLVLLALLAAGAAGASESWLARVIGIALVAAGVWLAAKRRPGIGIARTRRLLALVAVALGVPLHSFLLECLGTLQPIEFAIVPFLWVVLWAASELLRERAERRGALDGHGTVHRFAPGLGVTLSPWAWIVIVQLSIDAAWSESVTGWGVVPLAAVLFAAGTVAIGSLTLGLRAPEATWDARRLTDVRAALLPLGAPLLAFACLRFAPLPTAWSAASEPRGLLAVLAPQLVLPLAGAALVAAVGVDRLLGARRPAWLALGAAAIAWGASLVPPSLPTGFPTGFERAGLDVHALRPWAALLVALAALATWQRLTALARGQRAPLAALAAAPAVAVPAALVLVPADGPVGALWASSAGLVAVLVVDASRVGLGWRAPWRSAAASPH